MRAGGGCTGDFDVVTAGSRRPHIGHRHIAEVRRDDGVGVEGGHIAARYAAGAEVHRIVKVLNLAHLNVEDGAIGDASVLRRRGGIEIEVRRQQQRGFVAVQPAITVIIVKAGRAQVDAGGDQVVVNLIVG